jgi:hypothetical protein
MTLNASPAEHATEHSASSPNTQTEHSATIKEQYP